MEVTLISSDKFQTVGNSENRILVHVGYYSNGDLAYSIADKLENIDPNNSLRIESLLAHNPEGWDFDVKKIKSLKSTAPKNNQ